MTGKNLIGSEWSGTGEFFHAENPLTLEVLQPHIFEATDAEINAAIEKAAHAFRDYRNMTGLRKAEFLEEIAEQIVALGDPLIDRCVQETGLPEARLKNERGRTCGQLKLFAQLLREGSWVDARIDTADPGRAPIPKPDVRSMMKGLGPVGIFGASNFPLAFSVAGGDTASALAAGCPVVVKTHPGHPGTCELVATAILQAAKKTGMPDGVFSMVHGKSIHVGQAIVKHPLIKAIGFTGSFRGGKSLFDEANKREVPIPVFAEMGSVNPVFILPEIMKQKGEKIARDLAASFTLGVGQFCTNPGLVLMPTLDPDDPFRSTIKDAVSKINSGVMLTGSIRNSYQQGVERLRRIEGVNVVSSGKETGEGHRGTPTAFETTASVFLSDHTLEEEIFGPSTLLVSADNKNDLEKIAEQLSGHLTATVHGTEKDLLGHRRLLSLLEEKVGRVIINGYPTGVEVCHSMVHGGPFPATTDSRTTSVGTRSITRFARPICFQDFPQSLLPLELQDSNPLGIWRMVDGAWRNN
jgi:NADP-dependent aldehyde dehydrogenase